MVGSDPAPHDVSGSYLVFSQAADARTSIAAWNAHAVRFFGTRIGLTEERVYGATETPRSDTMRVVVAADGRSPEIRTVVVRPRENADLTLADEADARCGSAGLGRLAQRCPTVWEVERLQSNDAAALRLAAVLASVLLGPIVDRRAVEIFGVKTARQKLETLESRARPI